MARKIIMASLIFVALTLGCDFLYFGTKNALVLTLAITFGTSSYHFVMRLAVGKCVDALLHNRVDYTKRWFRPLSWEGRFYRFLQVKKWKKHLFTFDPDAFSFEKRSVEEVIGATCQAEIVHEIIIVLSFVPLLFTIPFGAFFVFLGTSVGAALMDSAFVILQRFNRPRLISLLERQKNRRKNYT